MKQDLTRIAKLYRTVRHLLPGYFLAGTAVATRNYIITFLNAFLGANVVTQCATGALSGLGQVLLRFALFLLLFLVFDALSSYGYAQTLDKIRYALRRRIYKNVLHAPLPALDTIGQRGELLSRMNQDVDVAMGCFQTPLVPLMFLISGIGATISIAHIHPAFPAILYVLGFGIAFSKSKLSPIMREHMKNLQKSQAAILSGLLHTHTWLRELRAARLVTFQEKLFRGSCADFEASSRQLSRTEGILGLLTGMETTAGSLLMLGLGIVFYRTGQVELSGLVYLYAMSPLVLMMFSASSDLIVSLHSTMAGLDRIWDLLYMDDEYACDSERAPLIVTQETTSGENLSCKFANGKTVFQGLNFRIPAKGMFAICGASGSGKTTLARMLLKLYPISSGTLRLFGQDLASLSCASVRENITYVTQESALPKQTIRENLNVEQERNDKALYLLLKQVAADWVDTLPEKLDTNVRELSGGQRQAVAIARALARNTPAYVLDEAFAGIDQGRIASILQQLKKSYPDRLFLVITHDPAAMALCDGQIAL